MTRYLHLLPLLALSILPADTGSALRECAAISSDSRRLSCYDDLAQLSGGAKVADWREDRSRGIAVIRDADRSVQASGQQVRPQLTLRCLDSELTVDVFVGTKVQEEHGGDDRTVILRFGHEAPFSERLATSADGLSLLFDSGVMAAGQLLTHDSLAFQFMPAGARPVSMNFDTRGLARSIRPLLEACRLQISPDGILEPAD